MKIKVKLLQAWNEPGGGSHAKGAELELDAGQADALVALGYAEKVASKVKVKLGQAWTDGETEHEAGSVLDLDAAKAKSLVDAGVAEEVADAASVQAALAEGVAELQKGISEAVRKAITEGAQGLTIAGKQIRVTGGTPMAEDDPLGGFKSTGHYLRDVKHACNPAQPFVSEELAAWQKMWGAMNKAPSGQSEASGEEGGFAIIPEFSRQVITRVGEEDIGVIGACDLLSVGQGNSITVTGLVDHDRSGTTYRYGGLVVYCIAEAEQYTASHLKLRRVKIDLDKVGALAYCTEEEISDSALINWPQRLEAQASAAIRDEVTEWVMFGNGVGKPHGAFADTAICVEVAAEDGQAAATVVTENIFQMEQQLDPKSAGRAKWFYNQTLHKQLRTLTVDVGTGGALVPLFDGRAKEIDAIPATRTEHCEAAGTAGDIVLGDFSKYGLAFKGDVKSAVSIHLRFDYDETAFKFTWRMGGRPLWDRYLTPRKGGENVSPFVRLITRD